MIFVVAGWWVWTGERWIPVFTGMTLGGFVPENIRFGGTRYFLWWKRMVFSSADVWPLDCRGFGGATDGVEEKFKGATGELFGVKELVLIFPNCINSFVH